MSDVGGGIFNECTVDNIDVKNLVTQLDYFESIYSTAASCNITLSDGSGFHERAKLKGGEEISINFAARKGDSLRMKFKVERVTDRIRAKDNLDMYLIVGAPQEMLDNHRKDIAKAYNGKKVSEMVKEWHDDYVKETNTIKKDLVTNEETKGNQNYVGTGRSPTTAIRWAAKEGMSAESKASNYLYYQDRDGYHFKTIDSMLKGSETTTFSYASQNIGSSGASDASKNIISFDQQQDFNELESTENGADSEHVYYYDPLVGKIDSVPKKGKRDGAGDTNHTGKDTLTPDKKSETGAVRSFIIAPGASAKDSGFVKARDPKAVETKRTLPEHAAQSSAALQLDNLIMNIRVPGDTSLKPGVKIKINIPSNQDGTKLDPRSGVYLVTAVRHVLYKEVQDVKYNCILECKSDSQANKQSTQSGAST
jgi:hypothetical protein